VADDKTRDRHEEIRRARAAASDAVVGSDAAKRLIVAGAGTGKTFTFREALERAVVDPKDGKGLALTFIRNLVADLEKDLGDVADVFTFHRYCKYLMHRHDVAGLREGDYYPPLLELVAADIAIVGRGPASVEEIDEHLHNLDEEDGLVRLVTEIGDYYGAVSHTDAVYRVFRHFEANEESIPTYPLVVVDEYQDFSRLETGFIELLAQKSPVLVAGDDDQALYTNLKHASPRFLRQLAGGGNFEVFDLPYCSRCTAVIVDAVSDVIAKASEVGLLHDRVHKEFACYLPDKEAESVANPKIIHAACSTANQPYAGRYIAQQIARIPAADVARSREKGYPTVLVIGPNPFLQRAFDVVRETYPSAHMKASTRVPLDMLAGYRRIALDENSRLGWRILVATKPVDGGNEAVNTALIEERELVDLLPADYVAEHREVARLVGLLMAGEPLSGNDETQLVAAADRTLPEIKEFLQITEDDAEPEIDETGDSGGGREPDILFTSLVGAKGLSAEHVFIVGMNEGHFPRKAGTITDDEVCTFIVALSRARKRCHVISDGFFGKGFLRESVFLSWIKPHLKYLRVDKTYDFTA
jgi:ATP-dependent DNA helicase UvrD/PcrA